MFKKIHLEPENRTFSEIMGNGKTYRIPSFQRDYSWERKHLDELWQDIEEMQYEKIQHFMGYLVFQTSDNKEFQIIDGQQRLTTISLLILAALYHFGQKIEKEEDSKENKQRLEFYRDSYMGVLDTVTLDILPKLTLNRHNEQHYKSMIDYRDIPNQRNLTQTNRKLNKAFEFFKKKLEDEANSGERLARFVNMVCDGLLFTAITVQDDLNAYLVFETLNARGVHLGAPDLFKNYLLSTMAQDSKFSEQHFESFSITWDEILSQLGTANFTKFLRSHVGSYTDLPNLKGLYRTLKKEVDNADKVMPYLRQVQQNAAIFAALGNPEDPFWREYGNGQYANVKPHLELLDCFNIKTPYAVLIAAYNAYKENPDHFVKFAKWIAVLSIRYNVVCQKIANEQERLYNEIAKKLSNHSIVPLSEIKQALAKIYPEDNVFQSAFREKTMPSRQSPKKILYLLCAIEKHVHGGKEPPIGLTVEHVLPQNPNTAWQESFGLNTYSDAIDRLGNMAILPKKKNMGQESFNQKKETFIKSGFKINQKIAQYDVWTIENLNDYQNWLANQAKAVWVISGL